MTIELVWFVLGVGIGSVTCLVGAWLSYRHGLATNKERTPAPLRYMARTIAGLRILRAIVVSICTLFLRSVRLPLIPGAGVIIGYWLVFWILLELWLRIDRTDD